MKINNLIYILCFFLLMVLSVLPNMVYADEQRIEVTKNGVSEYYSNLNDAILAAVDNEETVLKLLTDIELNSKITIPSNKNIVIDGDNKYVINYSKKADNTWYTGQLFYITSDAKLVLRNLTIDGQNNWVFNKELYIEDLEAQVAVSNFSVYRTSEANKPSITDFIINNAGNLVLDNATIKNCFTSRGLIYGNSATTTFKDAKIIHNTSNDGGVAIYQIGSTTTTYIEGNTLIEDNFTIGNGGIFRITGGSTVIMNGGKISNNKSGNSNGIVAMIHQTGSKFVLNDGQIIENSGLIGQNNGRNGVIYMHNGSTFIMNGGLISKNIGNATGGIDAPGYSSSRIELNGGSITNNMASEKADPHTDVYIAGDLNLIIGEKMYIEGDIYVAGDVVNNGTIKGDLTLALGSNVAETVSGTGVIDGDVIINYTGDTVPTVDEDVNITGNVQATNTTQYTSVRFFYNGGIDQDKNEQLKVTIALNDEVNLPIVTREGHTFLGWYTNKDFTKEWEPTVITRDTSLYAKWKINSYVLTFKVDDQEIHQTLVYGDQIVLPEVPFKDGFVFIGWGNYHEGMTMPDKDLTLVAKYKSIQIPGIDNPPTHDNLFVNIFVCIISIIGVLITILCLKKTVKS